MTSYGDQAAEDKLTRYGDFFEYLDELRECGATNMFGATPYLMREFGIERKEAEQVLIAWMSSFDLEVNCFERAKRALGVAA